MTDPAPQSELERHMSGVGDKPAAAKEAKTSPEDSEQSSLAQAQQLFTEVVPERARAATDAATRYTKDGTDRLAHYVRDEPLTSLVIAGVVGFVAGLAALIVVRPRSF